MTLGATVAMLGVTAIEDSVFAGVVAPGELGPEPDAAVWGLEPQPMSSAASSNRDRRQQSDWKRPQRERGERMKLPE